MRRSIPPKTVTSNQLAVGATAATYETALPANPVDGQEVYYAADATNGVIWHLRYRSASSSSYKWEFVGGRPLNLLDGAITNATITGGTWSDIGGAISITAPLAGDYDVSYYIQTARAGAAQEMYVGIKVDTTEATGGTNTTYQNTASDIWGTHAQIRRITGIGATKSLTLRFRNSTTGNCYRIAGSMVVTPVRVG